MGGHKGHEGSPLAGEEVLLVIRAVAVAGSEHAAIEGISGHRWFLVCGILN